MPEFITINDVGPRDGLQNQPKTLTPQERLQLIQALVDAGLPSIEFGAFVSPKAVPAMAGADDIARQLPTESGVNFNALIPNRRGYDNAHAVGVQAMGLVVAASDTMNEKNIRMNTEAAVAVCADVLKQARIDAVAVNVYVATAWECPFQGATDPKKVISLSRQLIDLGAQQVVISDTIGAAHPGQVRSLMDALLQHLQPEQIACHFHDTRAMGLANAYAAVDAGIRHLDASIGGLGGCPFAPGATGNVATEDLVMMLTQMGFETGIKLDKLLAAGQLAGELTGAPTGGRAYPWLSKNTHRLQTA